MVVLVLLSVDPNLVKPGWMPLVLVLLIGLVMFFLWRSMLRHIRNIRMSENAQSQPEDLGRSSSDH